MWASRGEMKVVSAVPADLHQSWAPSHHSGRKCIPYQTTGGPRKPKGNKGAWHRQYCAAADTDTIQLYSIQHARLGATYWTIKIKLEATSWVRRFLFGLYYHIKNKSPLFKEAESPREGITVNRCGPEGQ